jgi:thiol-disulfide isomerase/thioredoxin
VSAAALALLLAFAAILAPPALHAAPQSKGTANAPTKSDADAEIELQKAISNSGNDRAALVRNLKAYLLSFPDAPRKASVFRALVEACQQLHDTHCATEYAERLIAIHPDDSEMMLLAVNLLEQQGDDASLTRAAGYVGRVLDRVEKTQAEERPERSSLAEWQDRQAQLRALLYFLRGEIEKKQSSYEASTKDLENSYAIRANAAAAELLGEIAEMRGDSAGAIDEYTLAFVLPESSPAGKVDRRDVRMKLGNVWKKEYGTENGLGAQILAAYDGLAAPPANANPAVRNKDAKDLFAFVLRRPDGTSQPMAAYRGKVVALSFWATWCGPCRELEPVFNLVAKNFASESDVAFFAVNTDEDETRVQPFLTRERWDVPVVFADGLDAFLNVSTLPTVVILDHSGKIVYRVGGFSENFPATLTAAVRAALSSGTK